MKALVVLAAVFVLACLLGYVVIRHALNATVERQALIVAEIVASQATTARSVYAREIASKLSADGLGPHVDSAGKPGHVPLPAQFLKLIGRAASENSDRLYDYKPVSRWNLEPTQGLTDDFLRWAWPQLETQEPARLAQPAEWKAVSRIEKLDGRLVLRYLTADPASQAACAACHNRYEQQPDIMARRVADGVPAGKQWQVNQLLGALSVTIPLDKAQQLAGSQIGETSIFIFAILIGSFGAMFWFSWRLSRQERSLRDTELQLKHSEFETRNANALLHAKHGVEQAFAELSSYMQAIDQHAMVSVADLDGSMVQVNDKLVEASGYSRDELVGQDHRLLSSGTHGAAFFAEMWRTLNRGEVWRGVICNRTKDGALYWVDSAIVPLKDGQGVIRRYLAIRIDITARKQAEQEMLRVATHDALTGLVNRALLRDRIQQALEGDKRTGMRAAVLFIDLDQFKAINDSLGHETGDRLLVEVGQRLLASVRAEDTVARQGGDEFIVFMPRLAAADSAGLMAEKLLSQLALAFVIDGRELYVGSSIGIAVFPDHGGDVDTLLKNSDTAMYQVKDAGRNHYAFFAPAMNERGVDRYAMANELRRAAERGELMLYFQPIVGIVDGRIEALEVLLRWKHPTRGLVGP
ncbi:MAG: diguanylate cyclase, partial [Burkholderiaceae bacterium]